ncbi:hypothetical protein ACIOZL_17435 [Streptomyces sp. NPDC087769]|uniref:hypothetical protein n=1 Tax=Streptomyces sp. NPDC087769 TaxID=3365802 RepID=UPI00382907EF
MVSVTHTANDIEITTESLQEDLARLGVQKQALERELAAVVAHLGSVQRALSALQAVMSQAGRTSADSAGAPRIPAPADVAPQTDPLPSKPAGTSATTGIRAQPTGSPPDVRESAPPAASIRDSLAPKSHADADRQVKYGKLTEQILEYFAEVGDVDVRARDVAAALGRDTDSGSINAVRSTLDRLVGTSRIRRAGRGLYRAGKS